MSFAEGVAQDPPWPVDELAAQHEELQRLRDALARPASTGTRTATLTVLHARQQDTQP